MIERLSQAPLEILLLAEEEARSLGDKNVGTEHILLSILSHENAASCAITGFGIGYEDVRNELELARRAQNALPPGEEIAFSERASRILELAYLEAAELKHEEIGAEHLLLAVLRLGHGVAIGVLSKLGVSIVDMEIAVLYQCSSALAAPQEDVEKELLTQIEVWNRLEQIAKEQTYEELADSALKHLRMYRDALLELEASRPPVQEPEPEHKTQDTAASDSSLEQKPDSEAHSALDAEVHSALDAEVHSALDAEVHSALDSEVHSALDSEVHSALDAEVHSALDAEVQSALDAEVQTDFAPHLQQSLAPEKSPAALEENFNDYTKLDEQNRSDFIRSFEDAIDEDFHSEQSWSGSSSNPAEFSEPGKSLVPEPDFEPVQDRVPEPDFEPMQDRVPEPDFEPVQDRAPEPDFEPVQDRAPEPGSEPEAEPEQGQDADRAPGSSLDHLALAGLGAEILSSLEAEIAGIQPGIPATASDGQKSQVENGADMPRSFEDALNADLEDLGFSTQNENDEEEK